MNNYIKYYLEGEKLKEEMVGDTIECLKIFTKLKDLEDKRIKFVINLKKQLNGEKEEFKRRRVMNKNLFVSLLKAILIWSTALFIVSILKTVGAL